MTINILDYSTYSYKSYYTILYCILNAILLYYIYNMCGNILYISYIQCVFCIHYIFKY